MLRLYSIPHEGQSFNESVAETSEIHYKKTLPSMTNPRQQISKGNTKHKHQNETSVSGVILCVVNLERLELSMMSSDMEEEGRKQLHTLRALQAPQQSAKMTRSEVQMNSKRRVWHERNPRFSISQEPTKKPGINKPGMI
eukprot:5591744-Amphidinium_carterae.1